MPPRRRSWQTLPAVDPTRVTALSQALDLARAPTLVAHLRRRPLPRDVLTLIRLASGCPEARAAAAAATGHEPGFVVAAAESYLRQVVCFAGADPHRVLGVQPEAPRAEMRRNMRELVLWLHPDRNRSDWNAALMRRVLDAWQAAGDPATGRPRAGPPPRRSRRVPAYRPSWISRPLPEARPVAAACRRLWRAVRLALVAAGIVVPALCAAGPVGLTAGLMRLADDPEVVRPAAGATGGLARPVIGRTEAGADARGEAGCRGHRCRA